MEGKGRDHLSHGKYGKNIVGSEQLSTKRGWELK